MSVIAFAGARVHDGLRMHDNAVLIMRDGVCAGIVAKAPPDATVVTLDGGVLCPGFVDLQVNGGGGVMLDGAIDPDRLTQIAVAHRGLGTTALLPTLITDRTAVTSHVIAVVTAAIKAGVPGIIGLHLEGPHLSIVRKGAHDATLIRPMMDTDVDQLCAASADLPNLMVTVAAETVSVAQIRHLTGAGVIVALGHSDASFDTCMLAIDAGARCTTHLFNAMSGLHHRDPGLVGATLCSSGHAGLIADGIHVHPAAIRTALAAKLGPGRIFLVSDAMAVAGVDLTEMALGGRKILRRDGQLTLSDGTLAGADISLPKAVCNMVDLCGLDLETAVAMATGYPAAVLRHPAHVGRIVEGAACDLVHFDPQTATAHSVSRDKFG